MQHPFPKLYAQLRRGDPAHHALLNELGAYLTSTTIPPKRRNSGFGGGTLTQAPARKEKAPC